MTDSSQQIEVRQNLATPWLKSGFTLTGDTLAGEVPNAILGLVKGGTRQINQPLRTITNISTETRFSVFSLIVAIAGVAMGLVLLSQAPLVALIAIVAGVYMGLYVYTAELVITDASGEDQHADVSILDQEAVRSFAKAVNQAVVESTSAQRGPPGPPLPAAAGQDPIEQIERLKALLDTGAITQPEFEAQKQRILG